MGEALPDYDFDPVEEALQDTRPKLSSIQGGGETTSGRANLHSIPGGSDSAPNKESDDDSAASRLTALEGGGETTPRAQGHLRDADSLEDMESNHDDDTLGAGYSGKSKQTKRKLTAYMTRKRAAVFGGVFGTGVFGTIITFFMMGPLKIVAFTETIQQRAEAAVMDAMTTTADGLLSSYYVNYVANSIDRGTCKSTVSPDCVVTGKATGPVGKLYQSWRQDKLQYKLASKYGIIFDKKNGNLHATIGDIDVTTESLQKFKAGEIDITQLEGRSKTNRAEARQIIHNATENETFFKRVWHRYQYNNLLRSRFDVRRCTVGCNYRDDFKSTIKEKKLAGKLFLAQKVGGVVGESYGILLECIIDTGTCETKLTPTTNGTEPRSKVQAKLDEKLTAYIASNGAGDLAQLVAKANDINKLGIGGFITREIGSKIAGFLGGEATKEITEKAIAKTVPYLGWASLVLDLRQNLPKIGETLKAASYAMNVAAAVALFNTYQSHASEIKSGHTDMTETGSLSDTLSEGSNMTAAPMYDTVAYGTQGTGTNSSLFALASKYLSGNALAASAPIDGGAYKCDDGKPVPSGENRCPEEDFTNAGAAANGAYNLFNQPIIKSYMSMGDVALSPLYLLNKLYKWTAGVFSAPLNAAVKGTCNVTPFCNSTMDFLTSKGGEFVGWFINHIKPNPFLKLTGGRIFDMATAGAEAAYSKSAMLTQGAAEISPQAYNDIQNRRIADEQASFRHQSLAKRLFDTSSTHSLITQVALNAPSGNRAGNSAIASLVTSPFGKISQAIASIGAEKQTFASTAQASPFGIKYYGYTNIPKNPAQYWTDHCEGRDFRAEWFSKMTDENKDTQTGEAKPVSTEPCMLIESTIKAMGGMFDNSFNDTEDGTTSGSVGSTGNFTFPLKTTQSAIKNHKPTWCYTSQTNCHHEYPAADIFTDPGTEVVAAVGGEVITSDNLTRCAPVKGMNAHLQIKGTDGKYYFYAHMATGTLAVSKGQTVKAGDKLGIVGPSECAQGTDPHLHVQMYTSVINGDSQSMNIQPQLVSAFGALAP